VSVTEKMFMDKVIQLAFLRGWMVAHFLPAKLGNKWVTHMAGHVGFPDLVLVRGGVVIIAELKTDIGRVGFMQKRWLDALGPVGRLWRPKDWEQIMLELA
jgi:hypothetical protein